MWIIIIQILTYDNSTWSCSPAMNLDDNKEEY